MLLKFMWAVSNFMHFYGHKEHKPVIDAVLVVDMEKLVFDPRNLFGGLPSSLSLQRILLVDRSQAHHCFLTHTPLTGKTARTKTNKTFGIKLQCYTLTTAELKL